MFEPTERELDEQVKQSIEQFERSRIGETSAIEPRSPRRILLVLDGSAQDETSLAIAAGLHNRFQAETFVLDARENVAENTLAEDGAARLAAQAIEKPSGDSYEQILSATNDKACELVIVPSPFGRDLEKVGSDSTGTVIDILLTRSQAPLLVVRRKFAVDEQPFARVQLVLLGENATAREAGAWAAGLVAEGGQLQLAIDLPDELLREVCEMMKSLAPDKNISPEQIAAVMERDSMRTHRALQLAAANAGFEYDLAVHSKDPFHFDTFDEAQPGWLLVLALGRQAPASEGRVHDRIRRSPLPVLVVPNEEAPP